MSATVPPVPTPTEAATASVRDELVGSARDLPDLIAKAKAVDPALAEQLTAKPLIASKTPAGVVVSAIVGWLVGHFGLACGANADPATCWSPDTISLVSGILTVVGAGIGAYAMRLITSSPIKGIFSKGATP